MMINEVFLSKHIQTSSINEAFSVPYFFTKGSFSCLYPQTFTQAAAAMPMPSVITTESPVLSGLPLKPGKSMRQKKSEFK